MMHLNSESGLVRALEKFRPLCGKRIAMLEADGLDLERSTTLREAFELAGAEVVLIADNLELKRAKDGEGVRADARLRDAAPELFHALCIPGAAAAVEQLRRAPEACDFVRSFVEGGKWIATLDHGALLVEDAGLEPGVALTSNPEIRVELEAAGADWVSDAVIADHQLITARGDDDFEAFVRVASLSFQEKPSEPPPGYH
ncbi:MAG TPA: DJ-1/PfpI family protein [Polyangiaceae bacterium]